MKSKLEVKESTVNTVHKKNKRFENNKTVHHIHIFGLNLGEGGHYGAFVIDLQQHFTEQVLFREMSNPWNCDTGLNHFRGLAG